MVETDPRKPWWLCHSPRRRGCHGTGTHSPWAGFYGVLSFRQVIPSQVSVQGNFSIQGEFPCPELCFLALEGSGGAGEVISVPELPKQGHAIKYFSRISGGVGLVLGLDDLKGAFSNLSGSMIL